jgi:glycosyltransferase involved in cell wall biosynthesis
LARILTTTIGGIQRVAPSDVTVLTFPAAQIPNRWIRNFRTFWSARASDHLVIDFDLADVAFFAILFTLLPSKRCRITTLDLFVGKPSGLRLQFIRWCVRRVDRLLVYFRDSATFESLLAAPASKFRYIPFKINGIERIAQMAPTEEGFLFCGGRSRRDFRTLFEAVRDLPYPVKVVTSEEWEMLPHGSSMRGLTQPPNVEIIRRDSDQAFFLDCMARSNVVVLPLVKDTLTQAGIGVYIQAMALRKCVIVSAGLGVRDVLTDQAVLVAPEDAASLREAIIRVWNDDALRQEYAERGHRYATALGGEDRLYRGILAELPPGA